MATEASAAAIAERAADGRDQSQLYGPSFVKFDPTNYDALLAERVAAQEALFAAHLRGIRAEVHASPPARFRLKTGFGVYDPQQQDQFRQKLPPLPAEGAQDWQESGGLAYVYYDGERNGQMVWVRHNRFEICCEAVYELMPRVLVAIATVPALRRGLRAAKFLATLSGTVMLTLVYKERHLGEGWLAAAVELKRTLGLHHLLGRSKDVRRIVDDAEQRTAVLETAFQLESGRTLQYLKPEDGFSNPNGAMAIHTMNWLCSCAAALRERAPATKPFELLEMFCGNGNHTCAVAESFDRVLAIEINGKLVAAANENFALNGVTNAVCTQVDAKRFTKIGNIRAARWEPQDGSPAYEFGAVLVDPPRAGLDDSTRQAVSSFASIMYICCQPSSLLRDLEQLSATHAVTRFAFFDHFPYTKHVEVGVLLERLKT